MAHPKSHSYSSGRSRAGSSLQNQFRSPGTPLHCPSPKSLLFQRDSQQKVPFGSTVIASHSWSRLLILSHHYIILYWTWQVTKCDQRHYLIALHKETSRDNARKALFSIHQWRSQEWKKSVDLLKVNKKVLEWVSGNNKRRNKHKNQRIQHWRVAKCQVCFWIEKQPDQTEARQPELQKERAKEIIILES